MLKLNLPLEVEQKLRESATAELRPIPLQAEVLIRRALGLPVPIPSNDPQDRSSGDAVLEAVRA